MGRFPMKTNSFTKFLIEAQIFFKPFLGKTDEAGLKLFNDMLKSADLDFIRWAWNHIPEWKYNKKIKAPFVHLHGTQDLIFPIKHIDQAITLKGATHYAIYDEIKKLNRLIELYL
jgi:pimeloyl-ACP methyl ester carboxylesterase